MAGRGSLTTKTKAVLAAAAASAETVRTVMGLKISGMLKSANAMAPTEKPICTEIVSQEPSASPECHMAVTCGNTAVPVNHNDIASSSARESKTRTRRDDGSRRAGDGDGLISSSASCARICPQSWWDQSLRGQLALP